MLFGLMFEGKNAAEGIDELKQVCLQAIAIAYHCIGHRYIGHHYIGYNHLRHRHIGNNYIGQGIDELK